MLATSGETGLPMAMVAAGTRVIYYPGNFLLPDGYPGIENGRILQISVQHQHCENSLQLFDDSYLQHKQQKKCALKSHILHQMLRP